MAEFVLKNAFFEFNNHIKQQISGTTIGTKCVPSYAYCIGTEFLEIQRDKPFCWVRYTDDIFFIWTDGQEKLKLLLKDFHKFHLDLKITSASSEEKLHL